MRAPVIIMVIKITKTGVELLSVGFGAGAAWG